MLGVCPDAMNRSDASDRTSSDGGARPTRERDHAPAGERTASGTVLARRRLLEHRMGDGRFIGYASGRSLDLRDALAALAHRSGAARNIHFARGRALLSVANRSVQPRLVLCRRSLARALSARSAHGSSENELHPPSEQQLRGRKEVVT